MKNLIVTAMAALLGLAAVSSFGGVSLNMVAEYDFAVNGCGGITYAGGDLFYVLRNHASDVGEDGRAKVYPLHLGYDKSTGAITSQKLDSPITPGTLAASEGIAYDPGNGCLWISDEATPTIAEFYGYGMPTERSAPVPALQKSKKRSNRSLESLTISGDGLTMWTANEQALTCDGQASDGSKTVQTVVRLIRYDRPTVAGEWKENGQWAYKCDTCEGTMSSQSGLTGLCALPDGSLLTLEREVSIDSSGRCRIYRLTKEAIAAATDVTGFNNGLTNGSYTAVNKGAYLLQIRDPNRTGKYDWNMIVYEGICLGPRLSNGDLAVYLVSDGGEVKEEFIFTTGTLPRLCALRLSGLDVRTVTFDLGGRGRRIGGGELSQYVPYGSAAVAPEVAADDYGWHLAGWNRDFSCVTEDMTITAQWECFKFSEKVGGITWEYLLTDGVATIDNNGGAAVSGAVEDEVVVPATLGGHPVAAVGAGAFRDCAALEELAIPAGVMSIGEEAFAGCTGLTVVRFAGQPPAGIRESGLLDGKARIHGPAVTTVSPADRTVFAAELAVTLSTDWPNGVVRYTLDGSEPTAESPEFAGISVHNKTTVRAAAFVDGLRWGDVAEATYGVGKVAMPEIASEAGDVFRHNDNPVTLTCATQGVEIRYTLDGREPTTDSALYAAPFTVSRTTTVRAKAFGHPDYVDSDTAERRLVREWEGLATPTISPDGGAFAGECQEVTVSCESEGVTVYYTLDGSVPSATNGRTYAGPFKVYRTATVRAVATRYGWRDSEVAEAAFTRANALGEAVNYYGALAKTDEARPWTVDRTVSHDGESSARSAAVEGDVTYLTFTVKGPGRLSFWWRASCEEEWDGERYDYGAFKVGGEERAAICGQTGWRKVVVEIEGAGNHPLRWEYAKDGETDEGEDCVWVDQVVWVPEDGSGVTLTSGVPVPYAWLEGYGLGADSDFEAAANAATGKRTAFGRELTAWEEYIMGTDPTNPASVFRAYIDVSGVKPKVTWLPDLNEGGTKRLRDYRVLGAKTPDGQWFEVNGDEEKYNFFHVRAEMPKED